MCMLLPQASLGAEVRVYRVFRVQSPGSELNNCEKLVSRVTYFGLYTIDYERVLCELRK